MDKACYDAENDVMLDDDDAPQKARTKFLHERRERGNMMVSGEGEDIWYQRLWRQQVLKRYRAIIAQSRHYLLPLFRFNQSR